MGNRKNFLLSPYFRQIYLHHKVFAWARVMLIFSLFIFESKIYIVCVVFVFKMENDLSAILTYLEKRHTQNPYFYYDVKVSPEGRMVNFLWVNGKSRLWYDYFSDVIVFDSTNGLFKYNKSVTLTRGEITTAGSSFSAGHCYLTRWQKSRLCGFFFPGSGRCTANSLLRS